VVASDLFELPSIAFCKRALKAYDESKHPRDAKGRWSSAAGGAAAIAGAAGAGLLTAASLGHPLGRKLLPGVRRAILTGRYRTARQASRSAYDRSIRSPLDLMAGSYGASSAVGREHGATNAIRAIEGVGSPAYARRRAALTAAHRASKPPTPVPAKRPMRYV
jgi:hypothetical protein